MVRRYRISRRILPTLSSSFPHKVVLRDQGGVDHTYVLQFGWLHSRLNDHRSDTGVIYSASSGDTIRSTYHLNCSVSSSGDPEPQVYPSPAKKSQVGLTVMEGNGPKWRTGQTKTTKRKCFHLSGCHQSISL